MNLFYNFDIACLWLPLQPNTPRFKNCLRFLEFPTFCSFSSLLLYIWWNYCAIWLSQKFVFIKIYGLKFCNDSDVIITIRCRVRYLSLERKVLMFLKIYIHFEQAALLFNCVFKCKIIVDIHITKIFFNNTTITLLFYIFFISKC